MGAYFHGEEHKPLLLRMILRNDRTALSLHFLICNLEANVDLIECCEHVSRHSSTKHVYMLGNLSFVVIIIISYVCNHIEIFIFVMYHCFLVF